MGETNFYWGKYRYIDSPSRQLCCRFYKSEIKLSSKRDRLPNLKRKTRPCSQQWSCNHTMNSIDYWKVNLYVRLSTSKNCFYCFCFAGRNNLVFQFYIAKSSFRKRKEAILKKGIFCWSCTWKGGVGWLNYVNCLHK